MSACSAGLTEIHCHTTALPNHSSVEGAAENPVDLPDGRVSKPATHVRLAGPVLQVWPAVAVLPASPELRVEGVQRLDVEPGQR